MSGRPWMPLYVGDYLRDTRLLSTLEHGAYMLLIMEYWTKKSLPDDDGKLARIAGLSREEWADVRPNIAGLFEPGWRHKRIEKEIAKAEGKSEAARNAAELRWQKEKDAEAMRTHSDGKCAVDANAMLPEPQPDISLAPTEHSPKPAKPVRTRKAYPEDFLSFWEAYPTDANMSKAEAGKVWARLPEDDRQAASRSVKAFRAYCTSNPDYRPVHACRFLSQRRFEGFSKVAERSASVSIVVRRDTPQGEAWERYNRATKGKGLPWVNGSWHLPSEWPPDIPRAPVPSDEMRFAEMDQYARDTL